MDATPDTIALRARYVFPVLAPPIDGGVVTIRGDRIVAVGKSSDVPAIDLGNVAIVPGLVNAHTHLEFSELAQPLGAAGMPLPEWIRQVIRYRREHLNVAEDAVPVGVAESLFSGTTSLGEISTVWSARWTLPETATVFREIICLERQQFDATSDRADQALQKLHQSQRGLSPHAPYSVHPDMVARLVEWAARENWPVAMHLAESSEEIELLNTGRGPFRQLLEELGVWRDDANPVGRRPLDYLQLLSHGPRTLVVHGNYLDDDEIQFLGQHSARMATVHCPRTHAFFGHSPYPLERMLAQNVTVCLGTDSRASNPDLSLFEEVKFVAWRHTAISPEAILRMATLNGARMLGTGQACGAIAPHQRADLAVVQLPEQQATDPYELLLNDESRVIATYYAGRRLEQPGSDGVIT